MTSWCIGLKTKLSDGDFGNNIASLLNIKNQVQEMNTACCYIPSLPIPLQKQKRVKQLTVYIIPSYVHNVFASQLHEHSMTGWKLDGVHYQNSKKY